MNQKQVTIIVGAQWGDEGKGKIVDYLTKNTDYVIRFHGGNNAGHTLVVGDEVYKLNLIPSGVLDPEKVNVIGNGVLIDPKVLIKEIEDLKVRGIEPNLKISQRAHLIMPYHIAMDEALSGHQGKLSAGSTKKGIAPVAGDKYYRMGIRVIDLLEPEILKEKLEKAYNFNTSILKEIFNFEFEITKEEIFNEYLEYGKKLNKYVTDTESHLWKAYKLGKKFLYEGAQGMSLDPDHGIYPHTTSTNNVASYAGVGSGICLNCQTSNIGIVKGYVSRVGNSPFPTELNEEEAHFLREKGGEYGTVTKRPRRVGWLDLVQLKQAVRCSGLTDLAVTKLDVLGGFEELKICTEYKIKREGEEVIIEEIPASLTEYREIEPVYKTLSGWKDLSNEKIEEMCKKGYSSLPENMKKYIEFIEGFTGVPASIISIGPKRHQTILK